MKEPCFTYLYDGEWRDWRQMAGHTISLPGTTIKVVKGGVHIRLQEVCVGFEIICPCGDDHKGLMPLPEFVIWLQTGAEIAAKLN